MIKGDYITFILQTRTMIITTDSMVDVITGTGTGSSANSEKHNK